jgi:hypothetical protein
VALQPHEIQFGILKRLRGTPIIRHTEAYGLIFDPHPPYTILATNKIDFATMQRLQRFSRYWDLVANSGRFAHTLPILLGDAPFANFMAFSDWLYGKTDATHRIALDRLAGLVGQWLRLQGMRETTANALLSSDYAGKPMKPTEPHAQTVKNETAGLVAPRRQARHLAH